jgi:ATP-dependent RNA helicase DDX18/HAS1
MKRQRHWGVTTAAACWCFVLLGQLLVPQSSSTNAFQLPQQQQQQHSGVRRLLYSSNNNNNNNNNNKNSYAKNSYDQNYNGPKGKRELPSPSVINNYYDDDDVNNSLLISSSPPPPPPPASSSHFYSRKSLTDPSFGLLDDGNGDDNDDRSSSFASLCRMANIERPSKIQALAWPAMLLSSANNGPPNHCVIADQTGSGKTYAYLLPLLQRLRRQQSQETSSSVDSTSTAVAPRLLILAPTSELADQIYNVIDTHFHRLVATTVLTGSGGQATNIRDQVRLLRSARRHDMDVLVTTPGRIATILRTRHCSDLILSLHRITAVVFDEVDILLLDPTFAPQLETIGAAVRNNKRMIMTTTTTTTAATTTATTTTRDSEAAAAAVAVSDDNGAASDDHDVQFVFCTATLPDRVLQTIRTQFPSVQLLKGPGLHKIAPTVTDTLVDVSVPPPNNNNGGAGSSGDAQKDGMRIKMDAVLNALRLNRCRRTLIFGNTVQSCRAVVNAIQRHDRSNNLYLVDSYHNAMTIPSRQAALATFTAAPDTTKSYILVATDRAARGVELGIVDHILLYDFANGPAEYMRRVGRTARAGRTGAVTILAYGWQLPIARQLLQKSTSKGGRKTGKKQSSASSSLDEGMFANDGENNGSNNDKGSDDDEEWSFRKKKRNAKLTKPSAASSSSSSSSSSNYIGDSIASGEQWTDERENRR